MKKIVLIAAAAGLISLAACNPTVENTTAENMVENLELMADNFDAMADNTTNTVAEDMLENQADVAEGMADNIADNAM